MTRESLPHERHCFDVVVVVVVVVVAKTQFTGLIVVYRDHNLNETRARRDEIRSFVTQVFKKGGFEKGLDASI